MTIGNDPIPTSEAEVDANKRAVSLVRSAEGLICDAARRGEAYSLQELRDLVRNFQLAQTPPMGEQLMSLIAELTWAGAIRRKRYASGTPQGDDPAQELANARLAELLAGTKIFVLEGVEMTDGAGNVIGHYGTEIPQAGHMSSGQICSSVGRPTRLWGVNNHAVNNVGQTCNGDEFGAGRGGCGGGC